MIFKSSLLPKYYQIYESLAKEISEGNFSKGERFPSENELCIRYQSSRGTVREAIKMLLNEGRLERIQGKGTFISNNKIEQDVMQLMGFTELMQRNNKVPSAKLIEVTVKEPNNRVKDILKLGDNDKIVKIQRLRYGDDEPLIIEKSYFVYDLFKPLLQYDLEEESIFALLYKISNYKLGKAIQTIEAALAGASEIKLLKIDAGVPILLMKRIIYLEDDRLFQYSEDSYRTDKLCFRIQTVPYDENRKEFKNPFRLSTPK